MKFVFAVVVYSKIMQFKMKSTYFFNQIISCNIFCKTLFI